MLYIFEQKYFLSEYILEGLTPSNDLRVIQYTKVKHKGIKNIILKIKKYIRAFIYNKRGLWLDELLPKNLLDSIANISEKDSVLFWGCENLKDIIILSKEITCNKLNFYRWNPMRTKSLIGKLEFKYYTKKHNLNICTFDADDAKIYGQTPVNQVFRQHTGGVSDSNRIEFDIYFVGQDKNRARIILPLSELLKSQGISYKFQIQPDKHTKKIPLEFSECFIKENIPYSDVLKNIESCRCLLEILQEGQSGISMRTLEALFFRKKIITNNKAIIEMPFYNKHNIYVLGQDEQEWSIKEFLDCKMVEIPKERINNYEINNWVEQFK